MSRTTDYNSKILNQLEDLKYFALNSCVSHSQGYCAAKIEAYDEIIEMLQAELPNCEHYWVKAHPLKEKNQVYVCLNCDQEKGV